MTRQFGVSRFWPNSLLGQMLLAVAAALLLAQAIGAMLLYRAQSERRDAALPTASSPFPWSGLLRATSS